MKSKLICFFLFITAAGAEAQTILDNYIAASWEYNIPLSNKNFVGKGSGQAFSFGFRKKVNRLYIGFDFSYASYADYTPRQTFYADNSATTTDTYKYVYGYSFTLNADYVFRPFKKLMPFAGLGLGANSNTYKMYYNIYSSSDSGLGALIRPQAGVMLKMGKESQVAIIGVVHYDYSTSSSNEFNYSNFSSVGFRIGVAINIPNQQ